MVYKSRQIFLPFCHNSRVWRADRRTDGQTEFSSLDRVCIPCSAVKIDVCISAAWESSFLQRCIEYRRGLATRKLSVGLTNAWIVTKRRKKICPDFYTTRSEKSSINTTRKSTTRFPMSPRWTSYVVPTVYLSYTVVVPKPCKGAQKRKTAVFSLKSHFAWRKSATKFLCMKTVRDKVVGHSLALLSVRKWLVGEVFLNVNFALSKLLLGAAAVLSRLVTNALFASQYYNGISHY